MQVPVCRLETGPLGVDSSRPRGAIAAGQNCAGACAEHGPTGLTLFGAIDDLWADAGGLHYVVDYKATSKGGEVSLDAEWQGGYRRQVEFYQWLLRGRGREVSDRAWFVYANGIRGGGAFDDVLRFRTRVIPYDGSDAWVEPALRDVAGCLASGSGPGAAPSATTWRGRRRPADGKHLRGCRALPGAPGGPRPATSCPAPCAPRDESQASVACRRAADASEGCRGLTVRPVALFSDGRGQEVSHRAEESPSNLLGMRSVLPGELARLRQRVGARAAPRRAVRRRLVPVGYRPAGKRRQTLAGRNGRTLVGH